MLLITVPNPCHEDWNKMTPNEKGAFCQVCSKTVVDFTGMTDDEVRNYFISNIGQKTCGHFRNDQLANTEIALILKEPIPIWKKIVAAVLILFGSFLSGCKERTTGKIASPENANSSHITIGFTLTEIQKAPETKKPTVETICSVTDGYAAPVIIETTGEAMPEEIIEPKVDTIPAKPDSVKKPDPLKKDCDANDTTTIYYHP